MKIDYTHTRNIFTSILHKALDKVITGEVKKINVINIPSDKFCEITDCDPIDFNGWQCDWWDKFEYKGTKFSVQGCAWYATVEIHIDG